MTLAAPNRIQQSHPPESAREDDSRAPRQATARAAAHAPSGHSNQPQQPSPGPPYPAPVPTHQRFHQEYDADLPRHLAEWSADPTGWTRRNHAERAIATARYAFELHLQHAITHRGIDTLMLCPLSSVAVQ
eukprot:4473616-Pleurochrysis_carterae.AAC.1